MGEKWIPNKDIEFAAMADVFATTIAKDPARFLVSADDCALLVQRVREYCDARAVASAYKTRTQETIDLKDKARERAVEIVRRLGNEIRASSRISEIDKGKLRIRERPKKLGKRTVPFAAPYLWFQGAPRKAGPNSGLHRLAFSEGVGFVQQSKPNGAVRIELFADLVAQGDPIPEFPGQYLGGRPWYLRSFSRSPITVKHPVPPVPMLVVYWARWADAKGEVGPFSRTCVADVKGWSGVGADKLLGPIPDVKQLASDPKYLTTITQLRQIEQVTVQALLPESGERGEPGEAPAPKQLPMTGAA